MNCVDQALRELLNGVNDIHPHAKATGLSIVFFCKKINGANILILGITFKENITDIRNSRVGDIYWELKNYHANPFIYDPKADTKRVQHEYGISLCQDPEIHKPYEAVIVAVKHDIFKDKYPLNKLQDISTSPLIIIDIKGLYDKKECLNNGFVYWRL